MKLTEQKRLQILDAAEELFYRFGVEHTSMDQLALQAQVSKRTVYNHFETKELLFQAILQRMIDKLAQSPLVQFQPQLALRQQLQQIAQDEVDMLLSAAFLRVAKIAILQMMKEPALAQTMNDNSLGCQRYLAGFLQAACQARLLQIDDIPFAGKQFVYQLKALIFYPVLFGLTPPSVVEQQRIINETVSMFLARYQRQP